MTNKKQNMSLYDLPAVVFTECLLDYSNWNDVLRLRKVCRALKIHANSYIKTYHKRAPEIEIDEAERNLNAFIALEIGTQKLFLNNPNGYLFFEGLDDETVRQFFEIFGSKIKHLRVVQQSLWPEGKERSFLNSFTTLVSFEAHHFGWAGEINSSQKANRLVKQVMKLSNLHLFQNVFPESLKNLESIRTSHKSNNEGVNKIKLTGEVFTHCQKLKSASLPIVWNSVLPRQAPNVDVRGTSMGDFLYVKIYIEDRPNQLYSELGKLEWHDFINFHHDIGGWDKLKCGEALPAHWYGSLNFLELCELAVRTGLKLRNVSAYWFYAIYARNGLFSGANLGIPIVSLVGLHPNALKLNMQNLEKIKIPHSSRCIGILKNEPRQNWPALKTIDITIDNSNGFAWDFEGETKLEPFKIHQVMTVLGLYRLFFKDVVRVKMTELEIKFIKGNWTKEQKFVIPKTEDIVASCPNLKIIRLGNWPGMNKTLLKLWDGLIGLEEISLEYCVDVGNATFEGEDIRSPIFLKLKNLKKLTLKGLDQMPRITDVVFSVVFAKMNLREFILTSDKPLEKITKAGIGSLLEGRFGESIEKFSFLGWDLADVTTGEFVEMGKNFRSYDMI